MDPTTQQLVTSTVGLAGAPIVAQLVAALVKPWIADVRLYSPAALVLGVAWNLLGALALAETSHVAPPLLSTALLGLLTGLAAAGLSSSAKAEVHQDLARGRGSLVTRRGLDELPPLPPVR